MIILMRCSFNRTLEQCGSKEEYDQYLEDVEDISKLRLVTIASALQQQKPTIDHCYLHAIMHLFWLLLLIWH
jgi:hypothetical protein